MPRRLSLAGLLLLPAIATAQPVAGLYVGDRVRANFTGALSSSQNTTKIYTDPGPLGLLGVGG
jgi:hypothetical protein